MGYSKLCVVTIVINFNYLITFNTSYQLILLYFCTVLIQDPTRISFGVQEAVKSAKEINLTKRVRVKKIPELLSPEAKTELRTELLAIPNDIQSLRKTFNFVKWFVQRHLNTH